MINVSILSVGPGAVGIAVGFLVMSFLYSEQSTLAVGVLCFTVAIFGCCCCGFMVRTSPNIMM